MRPQQLLSLEKGAHHRRGRPCAHVLTVAPSGRRGSRRHAVERLVWGNAPRRALPTATDDGVERACRGGRTRHDAMVRGATLAGARDRRQRRPLRSGCPGVVALVAAVGCCLASAAGAAADCPAVLNVTSLYARTVPRVVTKLVRWMMPVLAQCWRSV